MGPAGPTKLALNNSRSDISGETKLSFNPALLLLVLAELGIEVEVVMSAFIFSSLSVVLFCEKECKQRENSFQPRTLQLRNARQFDT